MTLFSIFPVLVVLIKSTILYLAGGLVKKIELLKAFLGIQDRFDEQNSSSKTDLVNTFHIIGSLIQVLAIVNIIIGLIGMIGVGRFF